MSKSENIKDMNLKKPGDYTLLKDGLIIDGTCKPGYQGNLLIKEKKIEEILEVFPY